MPVISAAPEIPSTPHPDDEHQRMLTHAIHSHNVIATHTNDLLAVGHSSEAMHQARTIATQAVDHAFNQLSLRDTRAPINVYQYHKRGEPRPTTDPHAVNAQWLTERQEAQRPAPTYEGSDPARRVLDTAWGLDKGTNTFDELQTRRQKQEAFALERTAEASQFRGRHRVEGREARQLGARLKQHAVRTLGRVAHSGNSRRHRTRPATA